MIELPPRMEFDDLAWEKSDNTIEAWKRHFFDDDVLRDIASIIQKHHGGIPVELHSPNIGSYNVCVQVEFQDGSWALARFPCPANNPFPEEKVRYEVAVMRYIKENTTIPVPTVLYQGAADESPRNIGPFIVMEFIKNAGDVSDVLNTPGFVRDDRPLLDPNIAEDRLEYMYSQMADVLLQLSRCSFPSIGSLVQPGEKHWLADARPLTMNSCELVERGDLPPKLLPSTKFETAPEYFEALADLHIQHLSYQHNDAVSSYQDCRIKYIGRHLFRKIVVESQLAMTGPFKLFCDDLRPANMLVNEENEIVSVIDWEFSYAAPSSFAHSPPWWLLLEMPEYWPGGFDDWVQKYEVRLGTFLKMLRQKEDDFILRGKLTNEERLSSQMEESWHNGDFWLNYAARKSWSFDSIYWKHIDERFFGGNANDGVEERVNARLAILGEKERRAVDSFVKRKLEEREDRKLATRWEDC